MREIVIDTETTGLSPKDGHRIIEIAAVELIDKRITGVFFHTYIDPEREIDEGAFKAHGIGREKLEGKPKFAEIAPNFLRFCNFNRLIAHNFQFDISHLHAEMGRLENPPAEEFEYYCTLIESRRRWPTPHKNTLDYVCDRLSIDRTDRTLHGALIDAMLCANVYIELTKEVGKNNVG